MQFIDEDLDKWQLTMIIGIVSFLFSLSNKPTQDGRYVLDIFYILYDRLIEIFYYAQGGDTLYFNLMYININISLLVLIIFVSYFIVTKNIYLSSLYGFLLSFTILFTLTQAAIEFNGINLRLGFYLLLISYISVITSVYYAVSEVYKKYELKTRKIIMQKCSRMPFLSFWAIFIFNIILIILAHMRIEITII